MVTSTRSFRLGAQADLVQQIVHLAADRPHVDFGIDQAGGPDDLLDHRAGGLRQLVRTGRGRNVNRLMHAILEFLERQRAIVERAGQAESELDQVLLARAVAVIHALKLRNGLVAFVEEQQRVVRQIIQQRGRSLARQASRKMARIIFDAVAVADLADHLQIEHWCAATGAALRCACLLFRARPSTSCSSFSMLRSALCARLGRHHVVRLGIDRQAQIGLLHLAGERIDLLQRFDLIAPQADAIGGVVVGGEDLDHVAAHAKRAALEIAFVALVKDVDQALR